MTSVASAAQKPAADPASSGIAGKNASQTGDNGFAKALNAADDDGSPNAKVDPRSQQDAEQTGDGASTALKSLASLSAQLQSTARPGSAGQQASPSALQASVQQALADAAGQPVAPQAGDPALPQPTEIKAPVVAADAALAASLPGDVAAADTDLTKFAAAVAGLKRPASPQGTTEKKEIGDAASGADDAAGDAQVDPTAGDQSPALSSAEALLQLMGTGTAAALPTPATAAASAATGGAVAAAATGPAAVDDSDDALDFLSPDAAATDDTKTFRFQKTGDAAVAISLSLTKGESGEAELQESDGDAAKPEMVTVIDSRRYLGFGMGSNASNLMSAATGDHEWASAMHPASSLSNAATASSTGNVVNTLKLQLTPDHLGTVTANMRLQGDELSIHLTVHNAAAYRELSDDSKPMLEALRAQGFNVDQVTVSLSSAADPNSNSSGSQPQANSNPQAQQQQLHKDGEAARQQGQSSGKNGGNDTENRNETAVETPVRGGGNAGGMYL